MFEYIYLKDVVTMIDYYGHTRLRRRYIRFEGRMSMGMYFMFSVCECSGGIIFDGIIAN